MQLYELIGKVLGVEPSELNERDVSGFVPLIVHNSAPVAAFQIEIEPSSLQLAMIWPSGL